MSDSQFCFRACKDGPNAPENCEHIYDLMGCAWNMPANYDPNIFENCVGDSSQVSKSFQVTFIIVVLICFIANGCLHRR